MANSKPASKDGEVILYWHMNGAPFGRQALCNYKENLARYTFYLSKDWSMVSCPDCLVIRQQLADIKEEDLKNG